MTQNPPEANEDASLDESMERMRHLAEKVQPTLERILSHLEANHPHKNSEWFKTQDLKVLGQWILTLQDLNTTLAFANESLLQTLAEREQKPQPSSRLWSPGPL